LPDQDHSFDSYSFARGCHWLSPFARRTFARRGHPWHLHARDPGGLLRPPEEIAGAAVFLCGADASYVTGHVLVADGGFMATGIRR
jgi:NAD(P)-dependent dehydrogenase (short-subunit alcohol dehydrogenase family)